MPHTSRTSRWHRPGRQPLVPRSPWRRLILRTAAVVVPGALVAAGASSYLAVVTGELAARPAVRALVVFAVVTAVAVVLEAGTTLLLQRATARAETTLRAELITSALAQPLPALEEQGVGELLDRVDDDPAKLTWSVATLGVTAGQAVLATVVSWVVAGLTWWPAWIAFPLVAAVVLALARRGSAPLAGYQRETEEAVSDHVSQLEEAVAARDDLRTSLGQAFVLRRYAELAARILHLRDRNSEAFSAVRLRTELPLDVLVAAVVVGGAWAVTGGSLDVARLVTLWVLVTGFTGRIDMLGGMLPSLEQAIGTFQRVRSLRDAAREPTGGIAFPGAGAAADVELRGLTFTYDGGFTLGPVSLRVPAGATCALVGRTGSGKTTLTKVLSRAVEPPAGTVLVGGSDVTTLDLEDLRRHVGVVGQRTEILAATLEENVTLYAPVPRARVEGALDALGLREWAAALPDGLDTRLGPHGVTLSAGEEQLVAFARLLVRDVSVVVLDEATARMDPATAERVTHATRSLLAGRTGIVVAHRLSTARHADAVAVLDDGRLVEHGPWAELAGGDGHFARLVAAAGLEDGVAHVGVRAAGGSDGADSVRVDGRDDGGAPSGAGPGEPAVGDGSATQERVPGRVARSTADVEVAGHRREPAKEDGDAPSLARAVAGTIRARLSWLLTPVAVWEVVSYLSASGMITGLLWATLVTTLQDGGAPWALAAGIVAAVFINTLLPLTVRRLNARWWMDSRLRLRLAVLRGQTAQRRAPRDAPGEITARAQEDGRLTSLAWQWTDLLTVPVAVVLLVVTSGSLLAGALGAAAAATTYAVAVLGRRAVADAARQAGDARAELGRLLGSAFDAARTVKLAAAVAGVRAEVARVDARRVQASLRESRATFAVSLAPSVVGQVLTVVAWGLHVGGTWSLATALVVTAAISSFGWIGSSLGYMTTQAPVARRWVEIATRLAGTDRLADVPPDVDLTAGTAAEPAPLARAEPLRELRLTAVSAVHDDGTVGAAGVDLTVRRGELVLVVGRVGAGKSSLLAGLAGLTDLHGTVMWNQAEVPPGEREVFLRPPRVAYVAQVPRVVSGTIAENVALDHRQRLVDEPLRSARLGLDVAAAGGTGARVGHRGIRLSGGQVQRLALARALATGAELVVVDDVSSALDAGTEAELWAGLLGSGHTVLGSTSRAATLALADRVVVLEAGRVVATGPWAGLREEWSHLAG